MNSTLTHVISGYLANVRKGIKGEVAFNSCRTNTPSRASPISETMTFPKAMCPDDFAESNPMSRATRPIVKSRIPDPSIQTNHLRRDMPGATVNDEFSLGIFLQDNRKLTTTNGILTKKIAGQPHQCIITPPIKGPMAAAPDRKMDKTDSAVACFSVT
ncbi:hypothetical protein D3C76_930610 [compost metagenome]